jgi:monoamine oxidase
LSNVFKTKDFLRPTCKVGWQSDRKYWQNPADENSVPIFGGISRIAPNKMQQMWYPSNDYHDQSGILTGAYNYGDKASAWGRELPKARMAEARDGAEQLHGKPFAKQLKNGLSIAWQNMQYLQGGWVDWDALAPKAKTKKERTAVEAEMVIYDRVRSLLTQEEPEEGCATWCYNQLQKEDNGFFITGDQVSQLPGWQEGAMASALQIFGMMAHPKHIQPLKLYSVPNVRALVEAG